VYIGADWNAKPRFADPIEPPSALYTSAVAPIVIASAEALNTVRYNG